MTGKNRNILWSIASFIILLFVAKYLHYPSFLGETLEKTKTMKCCGKSKDEIQSLKSMPSQYGFTLQELRDLMELRGDEARTKVEALGGPETIATKLKTSTTNGINSDDTGKGGSDNSPDASGRSILVQNGPNWSKLVQNGLEWSKMVPNGPKWQ